MFLTYPSLRQRNAREYVLLADLAYRADDIEVTIKEGFVTDGASVPRAVWWFASPFTGHYLRAAVAHDAFYVTEAFYRKRCDDMFLRMMEETGVRWLKRYAMYWAVRGFGWVVWRKHTRESIRSNLKYLEIREKM